VRIAEWKAVMTTVVVNAGACGFTVTITAEKDAHDKITLSLETECKMVRKMLEDISVLDRFAPLTGFASNPVHRSASKHIRHVACAVPSAILKTLEVEAGLNTEKDVSIVFVKKNSGSAT
jgi:hypothetical protein